MNRILWLLSIEIDVLIFPYQKTESCICFLLNNRYVDQTLIDTVHVLSLIISSLPELIRSHVLSCKLTFFALFVIPVKMVKSAQLHFCYWMSKLFHTMQSKFLLQSPSCYTIDKNMSNMLAAKLATSLRKLIVDFANFQRAEIFAPILSKVWWNFQCGSLSSQSGIHLSIFIWNTVKILTPKFLIFS